MTRRRSTVLFIFLSLILVVGLLLSFASFTFPNLIKGNYYSYTSFLSNLRFGQDIGRNVSVVYRAQLLNPSDDYNASEEKTVSILSSLLKSKGYYDVSVEDFENSAEDRGFRLNIGNTLNKTEIDEIESLIGDIKPISFVSMDSTNYLYYQYGYSVDTDSMEKIGGADLVDYVTIYGNTNDDGEPQYYVLVVFNDKGVELINNLSGSSAILLKLGDSNITANETSRITKEQPYFALQSSSDTSDSTQAVNIANRLKASTVPLELTKLEFGETAPTYGNNVTIIIGISLLVVIGSILICYIYKFGQLGWLACYNFLIFVVLGLFFLQAIPLVHINLAGIFAVLIAIWLVSSSTFNCYNRAKDFYNNGSKLFASIKNAERDTLAKTVVTHAIVLVAAVVCLCFDTPYLHSFGWAALVLSVVSLFVSLVSSRLLNRMYLPFNSVDGKKCHFVKGGQHE